MDKWGCIPPRKLAIFAGTGTAGFKAKIKRAREWGVKGRWQYVEQTLAAQKRIDEEIWMLRLSEQMMRNGKIFSSTDFSHTFPFPTSSPIPLVCYEIFRQVQYSKPMPELEQLMEKWPPAVEMATRRKLKVGDWGGRGKYQVTTINLFRFVVFYVSYGMPPVWACTHEGYIV